MATMSFNTRAGHTNGNIWYRDKQVSSLSIGSNLWETCPLLAQIFDPGLMHVWEWRANTASDASAAPDFDWIVTEDDAACTQLMTDAAGGLLVLTNKAATDDNAQQILWQQECFKLAANKPLWFEAAIITAAGATQIDATCGLWVAEDLTGVADNMPANGIVFHKDDGDTNLDFSTSDGGTNIQSAAIATWTTSLTRVGFTFDGGATGSGVLTPYVNGVAKTAISTATYATMAEMAPGLMVRNGDGVTTQTAGIKWAKCCQLL